MTHDTPACWWRFTVIGSPDRFAYGTEGDARCYAGWINAHTYRVLSFRKARALGLDVRPSTTIADQRAALDDNF